MGIADLFRRKSNPKDVYLGLHAQALSLTREKARIAVSPDANAAWGVIMDWGVANGTATVLALADGSASVYLSSGGGFIGGGGQEAIRNAAQLAVKVAADSQSKLEPSNRTDGLPKQGDVVLYVLSDTGLLRAAVSQAELQSSEHPLSRLANAMQNVITQYRLWSEKQSKP